MKCVKFFPKFQEHLLLMATSTLPQNLQETSVTICSEKFGCLSQESLPKFKEHLFLMTAFKVTTCAENKGRTLQKLVGWRELQSMYGEVWGKKEKREYGARDSLEKGKYLANSYTAARVNVYYKLSSFFPMLL